jgi:hypothetical protein
MSFLCQIFYPYKQFDSPDKMECLRKYMLTTYNKNIIAQGCDTPPASNKTANANENEKNKCETGDVKEVPTVFTPTQNNSLFWCIFISNYGYAEYEMVGKKYDNRFIEENQKMVNYIKSSPSSIKETNYKVTNVMVQEILSEFMTQSTRKSNNNMMLTVIAQSALYKKHIFVCSPKNTYLKFIPNKLIDYDDITDVIIIYYDGSRAYSVDMNVTEENIAAIKSTRFCLEHWEKPLKGISNYKTADLVNIANILKINTNCNKPELYKLIFQHCIW